MNLFDGIVEAAARSPDRIALLLDGRGVTYRGFCSRVKDLSDRLAAAGIGRGDSVGIAIANPAGYLTTLLAIARVGAVASVFRPEWREQQRAAIARRHRIVAVATDPDAASRLGPSDPRLLSANELFGPRPPGMPEAPLVRDADTLPVVYLLSSGTTGMPRTVSRTHAAALANIEIRRPRAPADARMMVFSDLAPAWVGMSAIQALHAGATVVLSTRQHARDLLDRIEADRPTHLIGSTDAATKLGWYRRQHRDRYPERPPSAVEIHVGGAALTGKALEMVRAELATEVITSYGSSEASVIAVLDDAGRRVEPPHDGRLLPKVEVQALDADGNPLPPGEIGQLRSRSPAMASGYLDDDGRLVPFEGGWFLSDDLGSVDADGYLRLAGRVSQVINLGGRKVDPESVERAIEEHPEVIEAAVIAAKVGDAPFEVLVALIVSTRELAGAELTPHLRDRVPGDKIPELFVRVDRLPRNAMGKLMRDRLARAIEVARKPGT